MLYPIFLLRVSTLIKLKILIKLMLIKAPSKYYKYNIEILILLLIRVSELYSYRNFPLFRKKRFFKLLFIDYLIYIKIALINY